MRALVRPPASSYPAAVTRREPPPWVDVSLARDQHAAYAEALRRCGISVVMLPPDDEHPDAVFVQDPIILIGGKAVLASSALASRQGEADSLIAALEDEVPAIRLRAPATLDGGDVLSTGEALFVGLSDRTNQSAVEQLRELSPVPIVPVSVPEGLLHLLSGCSYVGNDRLLLIDSLADAPAFATFEQLVVPRHEPQAANVVRVGCNIIVPAGYPDTAALLRRFGYQVYPVPISEFEKRDGGVSCLSLLY